MIVFKKKLKGIVPYQLVYWPDEAALHEMAEHLPLTHYARVESATADLDHGRCIVGHHLSLTLILDLRRSLGELYKDLIPNARIRIHKAEKLGGRIAIRRYVGGEDHERLIDQFVVLQNQFVLGKNGLTAPLSTAQVNAYFPNADLFMAYLDGQPICGHLNLLDRTASISRLQDSANQRFQDSATARLAGILNVYLHWYEIERYREEGLASYDFGSLGQVADSVGVNRFKMQFGGSIIREHNYLMSGMPLVWRSAFSVMTLFAESWRRRRRVQRAGDQWRHMPLERIRQIMENSVENYERSLQARHSAPRSSELSVSAEMPGH